MSDRTPDQIVADDGEVLLSLATYGVMGADDPVAVEMRAMLSEDPNTVLDMLGALARCLLRADERGDHLGHRVDAAEGGAHVVSALMAGLLNGPEPDTYRGADRGILLSVYAKASAQRVLVDERLKRLEAAIGLRGGE